MGHVSILGDDLNDIKTKAQKIKEHLRCISQ